MPEELALFGTSLSEPRRPPLSSPAGFIAHKSFSGGSDERLCDALHAEYVASRQNLIFAALQVGSAVSRSSSQQRDQNLLLHVRTNSRKSNRKSGRLLGCEIWRPCWQQEGLSSFRSLQSPADLLQRDRLTVQNQTDISGSW